MSIFISKRAWGGATLNGDGKIKPGKRKPKDASAAIRMKKSKRVRVTKAIKNWQRP